MTHCQAYLHEQEARACRSRGDLEGFTSHYEEAATLFLDVGLISESSKCYESLGQYQKAAGEYLRTTDPSDNTKSGVRSLERPKTL